MESSECTIRKYLLDSRVRLHNLSGLLSGVSGSIHLSKSGVDLASVLSDVACAESLLDEAMEELATLHKTIRALEVSIMEGEVE